MTTVRFNLDNLAVAALSFEEPDDDEEADTGNPGAANLPPPPQGPPQGPLAATTAGTLTVAEAQAVDLTYTILLGPTSTLTNQERLEQISDQPPPFALLIIRHPDSTPALTHSIKRFHSPIGTNHPLHGCILGFIGDAMQWNSTPQLIQIPLTALSNTTDLQIAPTQTLLDANPTASTVAANATDPAQQTSTMINIPPTLIPFFLQHAHLRPVPLWRAFHTWQTTNQPPAQTQHDHIDAFLRVAAIRKNNADTHTSQLAIHAHIPAYDTIITKWAKQRAQQTMPQQPPQVEPPPSPNQATQTNAQQGIIKQLVDLVTLQTRTPAATTTDEAYKETSPEHRGLLSWAGLTDTEKIPPFWAAFRQATTDNGRLQILEKYMAQEKCSDYLISYSLRPDWIKDITKQKFWYPLSGDTLHRGITPFALQKLHTWHEADMFIFEETAKAAMHVTMDDINK